MSSNEVLSRDLLAPNAIARWARESPDAVLLGHVRGDRLTYAEVDSLLDRWATALVTAGVGQGEHVAYFLSDPIDAAIAWLALARGSFIAVPVNTANIGSMLRHVLLSSDAVAVFVSPDLQPALAAVADDLPKLRLVVVVARSEPTPSHTAENAHASAAAVRTTSIEELLEAGANPTSTATAPSAFAGPDPHDTCMLLFTSGTTGASKAVVVPWATAYGYWSWIPDDTVDQGESMYIPMPLFHISGLGALQHAASRGACFVTRDRFSGQVFWHDVRGCDAVVAGLVGPMTALLAAAPERSDDADNPLRSVILGPMIADMEGFERRFGVRVATCYGMTEVAPIIVTSFDHGPWQTCGRLKDGYPWAEARLVDTDDYEVPDGEVGELVVRTRAPWALNGGYYNNAEATATSWRNGWFHTGDAFRRDSDGWYYFVDRMKDTIRRRGENISSFEVESAVLEHPDVEACAAFGVPDTFGGDEVMVAVVARAGTAIDVAALGADLASRMPKHMVPRFIDIVDDLPRNTTSLRTQKFVLRDRGVTATTFDRLTATS